MKRVSPQLRSLAKHLTAYEVSGPPSATSNPPAFRTIEKLRSYLAMLMGPSGSQALLSRALVLAAPEVPWLSRLRVVGDGEFEGLASALAELEAREFFAGETVVMAHILRLLVAFIGPALTLRLLKQLWPALTFNEADFNDTSNDEDANPDG